MYQLHTRLYKMNTYENTFTCKTKYKYVALIMCTCNNVLRHKTLKNVIHALARDNGSVVLLSPESPEVLVGHQHRGVLAGFFKEASETEISRHQLHFLTDAQVQEWY